MANYANHLSYKNRRNGVIAERLGYVQFTNTIVADNALAGLEVALTENIDNGYAKISGATIIARSPNSEDDFRATNSPQFGIITPRSENFSIEDSSFFNFNWDTVDAAPVRPFGAIGTCSHCFHGASTDSGARTVTVSGLQFVDVNQYIKYQFPNRAIIHDVDGSLTSSSGVPNSAWATPYWLHNDVTECSEVSSFDGLVCDNSIQVRRLAFHAY